MVDLVNTKCCVISEAAITNRNAQILGNQGEPGGGVLDVGYVGFHVNVDGTAETYVVYKNDRFVFFDGEGFVSSAHKFVSVVELDETE